MVQMLPQVQGALRSLFTALGPTARASVAGLLAVTAASPAASAAPAAGIADSAVSQGIQIDFRMNSLNGRSTGGVVADEDVSIEFDLTDAATGRPLTGAKPAVWLDAVKAGAEDMTCKEKISSFLQGTMAYRPDVDLNTWYILAMNGKSSISVLDPLMGFGGQRLVAMVLLDGEPEEMVASPDQSQIYVTLPGLQRVAIVDARTWKVRQQIKLPGRPGAMALQPDGRTLWVTYEMVGTGGVAAIDVTDGTLLDAVPTGAGHHELAFSDDGGLVGVTNAASGTVTTIDTSTFITSTPVATGPRPGAIVWAGAREAFYVADEGDGSLTLVEAETGLSDERYELHGALSGLGVSPDGRYAFALDAASDRVHIVDAARGRVVHSVAVPEAPYQVTFTDSFAYVRSAHSDRLALIPLAALGTGGGLPVQEISGGQLDPAGAKNLETGRAVVPTPQGNAVLINSPAERTIYYYQEGMSAPMGSFSNRNGAPKGLLILDRTLHEQGGAGRFATALRLPAAGTYDVAFLLDSPRTWQCFKATVGAGAHATPAGRQVAVEFRMDRNPRPAGTIVPVRFYLGEADGTAHDDVQDVRINTLLAPGLRQRRTPAKSLGGGLYEAEFAMDAVGAWYVFVESPSLGLGRAQHALLTLRAVAPAKK